MGVTPTFCESKKKNNHIYISNPVTEIDEFFSGCPESLKDTPEIGVERWIRLKIPQIALVASHEDKLVTLALRKKNEAREGPTRATSCPAQCKADNPALDQLLSHD